MAILFEIFLDKQVLIIKMNNYNPSYGALIKFKLSLTFLSAETDILFMF